MPKTIAKESYGPKCKKFKNLLSFPGALYKIIRASVNNSEFSKLIICNKFPEIMFCSPEEISAHIMNEVRACYNSLITIGSFEFRLI